MEICTTKELAQALGITVRAVNDAVKRGAIPTLKTTKRGHEFDREKAIEAYRNQDIKGPSTTGDTYSQARAKDKQLSAQLKEIELQKMTGELVSADDVKRDAADFIAVLKGALFAIPDRVAPLFGDRQAELYDLLTKEISHALDSARSKYVGDATANALG